MRDEIRISELAVHVRIGVPEAERAEPQRLLFSITLTPRASFDRLADDLQRTVDYAAVAEELKTFVQVRAVKLLETLANEVAHHLLARFPLEEVTVEVRKFILPETNYVAARVTRAAQEPSL